jgi:RimJ/RimL family protein N-acetyltransferase
MQTSTLHKPTVDTSVTPTLMGQYVELAPLSLEYTEQLAAAAAEGDLPCIWYTGVPKPTEMGGEIQRRMLMQKSGSLIPFGVLKRDTREAIGMTSFLNIDGVSRRVEIGSTWYARKVQRTAINTEAKLLLMAHAFENFACIAVEFRVHFLNQPSRRAIERLGAKLDGILRNHQIASNGTLRDTCVYSVVESEWPAVKAHLRWQLERPR